MLGACPPSAQLPGHSAVCVVARLGIGSTTPDVVRQVQLVHDRLSLCAACVAERPRAGRPAATHPSICPPWSEMGTDGVKLSSGCADWPVAAGLLANCSQPPQLPMLTSYCRPVLLAQPPFGARHNTTALLSGCRPSECTYPGIGGCFDSTMPALRASAPLARA
jgi:hypothetical protein